MKKEHQKGVKSEKVVAGKKSNRMILAAFVIFICPIIAIFLGAFIGESIGRAVNGSIIIFQIIGGIVGFMLAGIVIKKFDKISKVDKNAEKIHWDDL